MERAGRGLEDALRAGLGRVPAVPRLDARDWAEIDPARIAELDATLQR